MKQHTIVIYAEDNYGVFMRIAGLFARRCFNLNTITAGKSENKDLSKIVITVTGDDHDLEQVEKQINKLIDIIKVIEMPKETSFSAELCLLKVLTADKKTREDVSIYANAYNAKIVGMSKNTTTLSIVDEPENIESFIRVMVPFGIKEISRTGITAISKDW